MIQLANEPNASRPGWRPAQPERNGRGPDTRSARTGGHAWPFLSRDAGRPARQDAEKTGALQSGS